MIDLFLTCILFVILSSILSGANAVSSASSVSFNGTTTGCSITSTTGNPYPFLSSYCTYTQYGNTTTPGVIRGAYGYNALSGSTVLPILSYTSQGMVQISIIFPFIPQYMYWFVFLDSPWNPSYMNGTLMVPGSCDSVSSSVWNNIYASKSGVSTAAPSIGSNALTAAAGGLYPFGPNGPNSVSPYWSVTPGNDCNEYILTLNISPGVLLGCMPANTSLRSASIIGKSNLTGYSTLMGDIVIQLAHVDNNGGNGSPSFSIGASTERFTYVLTPGTGNASMSTNNTVCSQLTVVSVDGSIAAGNPYTATSTVTIQWIVCAANSTAPVVSIASLPEQLSWVASTQLVTVSAQSYIGSTVTAIIVATAACVLPSRCGGAFLLNLTVTDSASTRSLFTQGISITQPGTFGNYPQRNVVASNSALSLAVSSYINAAYVPVTASSVIVDGTIVSITVSSPTSSSYAGSVISLNSVIICETSTGTVPVFDGITTFGCLSQTTPVTLISGGSLSSNAVINSYYAPTMTSSSGTTATFGFIVRAASYSVASGKLMPAVVPIYVQVNATITGAPGTKRSEGVTLHAHGTASFTALRKMTDPKRIGSTVNTDVSSTFFLENEKKIAMTLFYLSLVLSIALWCTVAGFRQRHSAEDEYTDSEEEIEPSR